MQFTAILLLAACLQVYAKGVAQVTLSEKKAPLEKVLLSIKKQSGYGLVYDEQMLQRKARPVDINVRDVSVEQALQLVFQNQPLTYEIAGNRLIFIKEKEIPQKKISESAPLLSATDVHGRVVNEKGDPVEGVNVLVKGTKMRTQTNVNGEFSLPGVASNATLLFTHVSMESFEYKVQDGSTNDILIKLKAKITALGEIAVTVNTGYQKVSQERFVGSFSQLDSNAFHRRAGMGIIERLDGTVPGVLFNKKGTTSFSPIQIRGISTLGIQQTSTDPLVVVDNFPMGTGFDMNNINPNDVESVTVLKDAAAASIWGSRAGNGVIVVTTKKGKYNQRFRLSVSSNVTIQNKPNLFYYPRVSSSDFINIEQFLFSQGFYDDDINNTYTYPVISPVVEILARQRAGLFSSDIAAKQIDSLRKYDIRNDLNKYVYRQAFQQQHYFAFSGGSNTLAYQFSAGYNHSLNSTQNSKGDNQYTINTNTSFRPINDLEIQAGIGFTLGENRSYNFPDLSYYYPYLRLTDDGGNLLPVPKNYRQGYIDTAGAGVLLNWSYRPLDEIRLADIHTTAKYVSLNFGISYKFTDWLTAALHYQYQNSSANTRNYQNQQTWLSRNLINQFTNPFQTNPDLRYPVPVGGILDVSSGQFKNYNLRGTLNLNKRLGREHLLTVLAGAEISDSKGGYGSNQRLYGYNDQTGSYKTNIDYLNPYPNIYGTYPGTVGYIPSNNGYAESAINRFVSIMANASYTYKSRYNFYASARKDGSNVYGVNTNNKWKPLWSTGASWDISKEDFFKVKWVPFLRLRASHGYTGNANNTISGKFIISYAASPDPNTGFPFARAGRAPNPDLKWEEVKIDNIGLDFQLLKNRISGSLEVFQKRSKDVIADKRTPPTSGVFVFTLNYASMKTNGFELSLNSKNTQGPVVWTTNFALSHAKTIVTNVNTSIGSKARDFVDYNINAVPGRIVYGISSYRWAGLDPATGDPQGYYKGQVSKNYQSIFTDSVQNQVFHGSALPLYSAFIRNNISWKGFTLSVNITGRFDYYFRQPALTLDYSPTMASTSYSADYYNRWQKPGDEAFTNVPSMPYPVPSAVSQRNTFYRFAEIHVKRADNIRLQDISLSYQWNNEKNKRIPFQSIRFFFYPNNLNLILWRASGSRYDPDFSGGSGDGDAVTAPVPKTWTTGMTINF